MDKRTFIKTVLLGVAGIFTLGFSSSLKAARSGKKWDGVFKLPDLTYSFDSLEPFMNADMMRKHYLEHHAEFVAGLNRIVEEKGLRGKSAYRLLCDSSLYSTDICNQAGGFLNHKLFWNILTPKQGTKRSLQLEKAIDRDFGSFENFRGQYTDMASKFSNQGWIWLISDEKGNLRITVTGNHDNPVMKGGPKKSHPILCLDLWDHAWLSPNTTRSNYIHSFWSFVNWDVVSNRYKFCIRQRS